LNRAQLVRGAAKLDRDRVTVFSMGHLTLAPPAIRQARVAASFDLHPSTARGRLHAAPSAVRSWRRSSRWRVNRSISSRLRSWSSAAPAPDADVAIREPFGQLVPRRGLAQRSMMRATRPSKRSGLGRPPPNLLDFQSGHPVRPLAATLSVARDARCRSPSRRDHGGVTSLSSSVRSGRGRSD